MFVKALALEAGQATHFLEEKLRAESEKRQQADEEVHRLHDELKKKTEELEAVKAHNAEAQSVLSQAADDAVSKRQEIEKRLETLKGSVNRFVTAVFGKSVSQKL